MIPQDQHAKALQSAKAAFMAAPSRINWIGSACAAYFAHMRPIIEHATRCDIGDEVAATIAEFIPNFERTGFIDLDIQQALVYIENLQTELAALRAEREWRPIETAPRDGTRVLVYAPPPDPAKWHGSTLGSLICTVEYHPDGGWCVCEIREATLWQPIPPAPEAAP